VRDSYVQYVLAEYIRSVDFDKLCGDEWIFDDEYQNLARTAVSAAFGQFEIVVDPSLYDDDFHDLFFKLSEGKGIINEGDEFIDRWFKLRPAAKNQLIDKILGTNQAAMRIGKLGDAGRGALKSALKKIVSQDHSSLKQSEKPEENIDKSPTNREFPASDRVVKLTDNQSEKIIVKTDEIIDKIEQNSNSIDGDVDLRSRLLGQLKAAKELFLAGVVKVELVKLTILEALTVLSEKYRDQVIGGLATSLIVELAKIGF